MKLTGLRAPDPDPLLPSRVVRTPGFGIGHVDRVAVVDIHAAGAVELVPLVDVVPVLVPDQKPIIVKDGDEQACDEGPTGVYFVTQEDGPFLTWPSATKMVPSAAVTTSVGSRSVPESSACGSGAPNRHQQLTVGRELPDDMPTWSIPSADIGNPDMAVMIYVEAVRERHEPLAPGIQAAACRRIDPDDRRL